MQSVTSGLMISAPRKSSGKTTITIGIAGALMQQGIKSRVFKKGPDYIDPMWHKAVTGFTCYNIDPYWMEVDLCRKIFATHSAEVDFVLVEGNHGLHDGLDLKGGNSSADLAKLLGIPVVVVIDSFGMNRGAAAVVLGQKQLDPTVKITGVILNNVGNSRQAQKQIAAIEYYCGLPVLGAMPRTADLYIKERHLGLVTIHESSLVDQIISSVIKAVNENCDLERIKSAAGKICPIEKSDLCFSSSKPSRVKIGVALDKAFCFYYPDNFEALKKAGAELIFFDTLEDKTLPEVDAVYIGGGFPESFLQKLENNKSLRTELKKKIEADLPVYAECGGMMYLTRSIQNNGVKKEMVGAIPADVLFQEKPVGKGYIEFTTISDHSWFNTDRLIKGHEFHYSRLENIGSKIEYNYQVQRGTGINGKYDGILYRNVLASYAHIHSLNVPEWASQFVEFVYQRKRSLLY